jgi:hypothetical protein
MRGLQDNYTVLIMTLCIVTVADERGSKTISMSQIGQELKDAEQNTARNIQEVRKSLVELGYRVGA